MRLIFLVAKILRINPIVDTFWFSGFEVSWQWTFRFTQVQRFFIYKIYHPFLFFFGKKTYPTYSFICIWIYFSEKFRCHGTNWLEAASPRRRPKFLLWILFCLWIMHGGSTEARCGWGMSVITDFKTATEKNIWNAKIEFCNNWWRILLHSAY